MRRLRRRARGVAAHHDDPRAGIAGGKLADRLAAFGVSLGGHGAGVDDAQIGRLAVGGIAIANAGERLAHEFGFVLVDFAAERDGARQRAIARVARRVLLRVIAGTRPAILVAVIQPARSWPTSSLCSRRSDRLCR